MEVWQQTVEKVATISPQKRQSKDFVLRVKLNPIEKHYLNEAMHNLNFNMSATIVYLLRHYDDISKARDIINSHNNLIKVQKQFELALVSSVSPLANP